MIMLKTLARMNRVHSVRKGLSDNFVSKSKAPINIYSYITNNRGLIYVNQRCFSQQTPNNTSKTENYKEDFEKMKKEQEQKDAKDKTHKDSKDNKHKDSKEGSFENLSNLKQNVFVNLKFGKDMQQDPLAEQLKQEKLKHEAENSEKAEHAEQTGERTTAKDEKTAEQSDKSMEQSATTETEKPKPKLNVEIPQQPTFLNKMVGYIKESFEETFPSEKYEQKKKLKKAQAKLQKMVEKIELTEEEIEKVFGRVFVC